MPVPPLWARKDACSARRFLSLVYLRSSARLVLPSRGTSGQIRVSPGGRNIIPGEAEISIEVRDLDDEVASRVVESLRNKASEIASSRGSGLR